MRRLKRCRHIRYEDAHCSAIVATVGQQVRQGEAIGFVGAAGNSTGNHLHFEVWKNGERVDAMSWLH